MRVMQRLFSTHSTSNPHQSARRMLRRLRIAIIVWFFVLAATILWFTFIP
jgi:hypothetical protein